MPGTMPMGYVNNFAINNGGETPPLKQDSRDDNEDLPNIKNKDLVKSIGNFLRQSLNGGSQAKSGDTDMRKLSYLNCLRKLFEEARASDMQNINGDSDIFKEMPKNFDGTIKKDDFIYAILNTKSFTLTRTEISNISALLITGSLAQTPKSTDNNSINLEDL